MEKKKKKDSILMAATQESETNELLMEETEKQSRKHMEKRKKDHQLTATSQEAETNDLLRKEDENTTDVGLARKNPKTDYPSHDNVTPRSHLHPPILQWPYTPQSTHEQSSLIPRPSLPNQQPPLLVLNQWQASLLNQQPQKHQQNIYNHQLQHGQPPLQTQSMGTFWLPQRPIFHAADQHLSPIGTPDATWQTCATAGGGASSRNEFNIPSFCYQGRYSHPMRFPGPWDPSSWWSQAQQSQPPCSHIFPGMYNYFPLLPLPVPDCSAAFERPQERGMIQLPEKLSQKHQQMWKAQSAENVQLWAVISHLQSKITAHESQLVKLEAEVLSQKLTVEESAGPCTGTTLAGKTSKRGRQNKSVASVDVLVSDECQPRARGRKPVLCKVPPKENIDKLEDKEKAYPPLNMASTATIQQENNGKIPTIVTNGNGRFELNESNLKPPMEIQATSAPFHNQFHQDITGIQIRGIALDSSVGKDSNNKEEDLQIDFSILSRHGKGNNIGCAPVAYRGSTDNRSHGWHLNALNHDSGRNLLDIKPQAFYQNGSLIREGGKIVPGWSFVNEDASEEHEDVIESGKDNEEEEMKEDVSSEATR